LIFFTKIDGKSKENQCQQQNLTKINGKSKENQSQQQNLTKF
jgi:hypothetical protein